MGSESRAGNGVQSVSTPNYGDGFSENEAAATENTPLLPSEGSSQTLRDPSLSAAERQQEPPEDDDVAAHSVTPIRAVCITLSMWCLIFLQASNMSGMTMTQSTVAADLDAYEEAMWFTSAYLITTSSCAPLVGRLSTIFTPGIMILFSSFFFAVGAIVASQAHSFAVFILGRCLVGVGGAGVMTLSLILVLQLTTKKRRGLFVGMVNAGFTIGLSTGAVVFGALLPVMGWRALFWVQSPIAILAGIGVFLSIPAFATSSHMKDKTTLQKLAGIDYAGAGLLVSSTTPPSRELIANGTLRRPRWFSSSMVFQGPSKSCRSFSHYLFSSCFSATSTSSPRIPSSR